MKLMHKNNKTVIAVMLLGILIILFVSSVPPLRALADEDTKKPKSWIGEQLEQRKKQNEEYNSRTYESWITKDTKSLSIYGTGSNPGVNDLSSLSSTWQTVWQKASHATSWFTGLLGGIFIVLGGLINLLLGYRIDYGDAELNNMLQLSNVDLSMDSVLFGRLLGGHPVDYVKWELITKNPYGVISAVFYRLFANFALGSFVAVLMFLLLRQLIGAGDSKKRTQFKDTITYALLMYLLLYIMPQLADICIYLRDVLLKMVWNTLSGSSGAYSYTNLFLAQWWSVPGLSSTGIGGLMCGILFFAASVAGIIFAVDYIKIAVKQTMLFGLFPVFALLSIKNRKILSSWIVEFFPNLFIPVIDAMLLLLPAAFLRFVNAQGIANGNTPVAGAILGMEFGVALITLVMIFSVIPMRKEILKLIGQANPMGGSRGLGGIMAAGMMAMRMMGRGGVPSGIENYGGMSAADNMAMANALEGFGSEGAVTRMAGAANETVLGANEVETAVAESMPADMDGAAFGEYREIPDGEISELESADIEEGVPYDELDTGRMSATVPDDFAQEGDFTYDVTSEVPPDSEFASRMAEDSESVTAATNEIYERVNAADRMQNLEAMDALGVEMEKTQSQIDGLSSSNAYAKSLLSNYEAVDRSITNAEKNPGYMSEEELTRTKATRERLGGQIEQHVRENGATGIDRSGFTQKDYVGEMRTQVSDREGRIGDLKKEHGMQQREMEARRKRESSFADERRAYGSSGQKFESAEDYRRQREVDEVYKKAATYKNFDTKGISEHLDPATRARMYRERAERQMEAEHKQAVQKRITIAGAAAGAVIGGSAGLYGGEQMAMSGATIGGMAGAMAAGKVSSPERAARKEELRKREPNVNTSGTSRVTIVKGREKIEGRRKIEASTVNPKSPNRPSAQHKESEVKKKMDATKTEMEERNQKGQKRVRKEQE